MKDMTTTRMLLTTAVLAAIGVLLATPAQAFVTDGGADGEGIATSGAAVASPGFQGAPDAIDRYIANQQASTLALGGSPDAIDRFRQSHESIGSPPDWMERYAARNETSTLALGGSPDAIDRYVANQQGSTLALGGSPDAIDRYMGRTVAAQGGTSGNDVDWTWVGLGAGLGGLLAAAMAGLYLSARQRGRVALP